MNILQIISQNLDADLQGRRQLADDLWLMGERQHNQGDKQLTFFVARCPGGAYSQFGDMELREDEIVAKFKTVWGIVRHRFLFSTHRFRFCDPEFPNNFIAYVGLAAANAQRCFDLSHKRSCNRWVRKHSNR